MSLFEHIAIAIDAIRANPGRAFLTTLGVLIGVLSVILLVGLEGMRYEEVALILGVPVGTVRSRLSRGREALRRLIGLVPDRQAEIIMADPTALRRALTRFPGRAAAAPAMAERRQPVRLLTSRIKGRHTAGPVRSLAN